MNDIHPLDRDDDDDNQAAPVVIEHGPAARGPSRRSTEQIVLRGSIAGIIACMIVYVASSLSQEQSTIGSTVNQVAHGINRLAMVGLLFSFFGVLLSYQWNNLRSILVRIFNPGRNLVQAIQTNRATTRDQNPGARKPGSATDVRHRVNWLLYFSILGLCVLALLLLASATVLASILDAQYALSMGIAVFFSLMLGPVVIGVVFTRGIWRACAIGMLCGWAATSQFNQAYAWHMLQMIYNTGSGPFGKSNEYFWTLELAKFLFSTILSVSAFQFIAWAQSIQQPSASNTSDGPSSA